MGGQNDFVDARQECEDSTVRNKDGVDTCSGETVCLGAAGEGRGGFGDNGSEAAGVVGGLEEGFDRFGAAECKDDLTERS